MRKIHSFHLNVSKKCGHCYRFCVIIKTVNKEHFIVKMVDELIHICDMNGHQCLCKKCQ